MNWCFETEPESNTHERRIPIPRGKVLGGSSSINGMLYVRGQPRDYDTWAQLGNRGWSFEEVLPLFKRSESFERGGDEFRGATGELNVADMIESHPILDAFVDAGGEIGYAKNPDYNGASQEGFGIYQVTQRNGRRVSTARAFLDPARSRSNLTIATRALAQRVLVERSESAAGNGARAIGVRYAVGGRTVEATADREVILAAGAVQSPQLLELSGIGRAEILGEHGIDVVRDLPRSRRELPRPLPQLCRLASTGRRGDAERGHARRASSGAGGQVCVPPSRRADLHCGNRPRFRAHPGGA